MEIDENLILGFENWKKACKKRAESDYFIIFGFDQLKRYVKKCRSDWTTKEVEIWVLNIMRCSNQKKNILKVNWDKIKPIELLN